MAAALTLVFVGLAFLIAIAVTDRLRGLGTAIVLWLGFTFLYDGLVLLGITTFAEYPLEKPLIAAVLLNPVDLARVSLLMKLDVAALMGYTGATFEEFFGTGMGLRDEHDWILRISGGMLQEHEMGRSFVRSMRKALPEARGGDGDARQVLVNAGRGFIRLIRAHINKENQVLFQMADQMIMGHSCRKLCREYSAVCNRTFEGRSKEELESLARGLMERYPGE